MSKLSSYVAVVEPVDIAIIGAGINGLAVAREAARRGYSVALLDRDDLGARTSAISTRLIHGGLKYLERFEIHLVHESIRERNLLLKSAPHLVKHYPMLLPFLKTNSRPGWLLSCGLLLHDLMAIGKPLPGNRIVGPKRMRKEWPELVEAGVFRGGLFHDAHVPLTERLNYELAVDAQAHGAVVLTHSCVEEVIQEDGRVTGLRYRDRVDHSTKQISARVVVNAAGPWVDSILDLTGEHDRKIGPTKGSHLVVDPFPGAPQTCLFFESPDDSRPMFVLPWNGRFMIGTTDLPYDGSLESIVMDEDEAQYLLSAVNTLIPRAELTFGDVLWSYSGVRPLPYVPDVADPAKVSREHEIIIHKGEQTGLVTLIGGKLTTHRALGETVVKKLVSFLGNPRASSSTRTAKFPGAPDGDWQEFRSNFIKTCGLVKESATRLVDIYGTGAEVVYQLALEIPELSEVVDPDTGAIAAEAVHAVRNEGAFTLEDVILRRMVVGLNGDVGLSAAPRIASVLVAHGDWSRNEADKQLLNYRKAMSRFIPGDREPFHSAS